MPRFSAAGLAALNLLVLLVPIVRGAGCWVRVCLCSIIHDLSRVATGPDLSPVISNQSLGHKRPVANDKSLKTRWFL